MTDSLKLLENRHVAFDDSDSRELLRAANAGALSGTAAVVTEYESKLSALFGSRHALAVSSGTAALHVLLYGYDITPGDEVILPPTAPVMTVLPIIAMGATPVFVDVEASTFGLHAERLVEALTPRTKLAITVPMWGYPTNVQAVKAVLAPYGIPLIEDSSHAHGTIESSGLLSGTNGDAAFFSTQERKLISTGEGGFILTDDNQLATRVRELRDFGKVDPSNTALSDLAGAYGYLFGLNFRITALAAALGIAQIDKLPRKIELRTRNASRLTDAIANMNSPYSPRRAHAGRPNFYSLVLSPDVRLTNADIGRHLASRGVISDIYRFGGTTLSRMAMFEQFATAPTPNSDQALSEFITLPVHEGLDDSDLDRIVDALQGFDRGAV